MTQQRSSIAGIEYIYLFGKWGYVLVALVCLFVCGQHYSKSYERIGMKFYGGVLRHILSPLRNLSLMTKCAPLTAHFVAPCTHCRPKTTKCVAVHGTFCRPWESTGRTVPIYTMLPRVWCIASTLRQAFPNWPWKLYCVLIKETVDSWNYLFTRGYHHYSNTGYLQSKTW